MNFSAKCVYLYIFTKGGFYISHDIRVKGKKKNFLKKIYINTQAYNTVVERKQKMPVPEITNLKINDSDDSLTEDEGIVSEQELETAQLNRVFELPTGSNIIEDLNPEVIDADADLTSDIPSDSEEINLIHLKIRSLEDLNLSRFTLIKTLCLRENLIDSIAPLKYIENKESVEELDFYDNRFNHISKHINQFTNLLSLDLSFNKLKHVKNIDKLTKLENLYLIENKIEIIENMETLVRLKNLELGGNRIKELPDLSYFANLEQLWVGKNKISNLQGLSGLTKLRVLSIQSNRLTKLEGLEALVNLEELYVSSNGISEIEGLDNCTKLEILDIGYNRISKLQNLKQLKSLTDLWCSYNQVSDFKNVEDELRELPNLECVYFEHNPLQTQNETSYRRKLKLMLPQISKIDATYCS